MRRAESSLDGVWEFLHETQQSWCSIRVPAPWQAEMAGLRDVAGHARYRRRFAVPQDWSGRQVALRFGAVSYHCRVWVNGVALGEHEGGYMPFEFVIPAETLRADNLLEVAVTLPTSEREFAEFPFDEIPHGKQSWYGMLGGIWQSVALQARHEVHVASCAVRAELATGQVDITAALSGAATGVRCVVQDAEGRSVAHGIAEPAGETAELRLMVAGPQSWSPDRPALYRVVVETLVDAEVVDTITESFGFRTIEARDGKLWLNGEPLYLRGALDQDYYPDAICTPPSLEFLEDQLRKARHLGLNCLRCHIKVPDPRYYEVADRLGMLVWTELPNVDRLTPAAARRLRDMFAAILQRDGNHPSIVIWTIVNENWGTHLIEDAAHRAWLADTYDWMKALDPTRLVVDNSACHANFHVKSDIDDYHYYRSLPERRDEWDRLTEEFAAGPAWTFSPHGDGARRGDEPRVLSEFGVWGLPDPALLLEPDGSEPWWMETGAFWGEGAAYPHGMRTRFDALRLDRVFGSFAAFIAAVQWQQFRNLQYQIGSVRAHPSIGGYVITELTDVHWEANGLLDLRRNPRAFHDRFAEINGEIAILALLDRWAFWAGETVAVTVAIATGSSRIGDAVLRWSCEDQRGELPIAAAGPLAAAQAKISLTVPAGASRMAALGFTLADAQGTTLAKATVDIAIYARATPRALAVAAADPALGAYLALLGYRIVAPAAADVVVTHDLDAADVAAIGRGQRHLCLADQNSPGPSLRRDDLPREPPFMPIVDDRPGLPPARHEHFPGLALHDRGETLWRGNWISTFGWLRRHAAFADLPGGPLLDLSFDRVVPNAVLTGLRPWEYESRVHAGVVVGWVHKPAALIGERRFGDGKMVATTFRLLRDPPGADPVATTLLHALLACALE